MEYDFLVIGGGSAGYAAASTAAKQGLKTVVVEGGREVGGLCILRGCMPSKTLIESANRYMTLRHAGTFGLHAKDIGFDGAAIIARKRRLIEDFASYRREQLEAGRFDFIRGKAAFFDDHSVSITLADGGNRTIRAKTFLISTGSAISWPDIPGLKESQVLTSDDVLDKEDIPESIIVLGGGPVALELAYYYTALGVKVTVVQRGPQLLKGMDRDVADALKDALTEKGMQIFTETKLHRVERSQSGRRVVFTHEGKEKTIEAAEILNGLGRSPNLSSLDLEKARVEITNGRIRVNDELQSSTPHIFAAGDCCASLEVVHVAVEQGEMAARNVGRYLQGSPLNESCDSRLNLFAVFTEPQVAVVGLTEEQARKEGISYLTAQYPFNDHGKSMVMDEMSGFVKLIVEAKSREIIGGVVVGPHGSDLIHEIVVAMKFRATAGQLATIPHYHPTLSEIWTYPAAELAED